MDVTQGYAYDNQSIHAGEHHDALTALTALLDRPSTQRIDALLDLPGKRCLEVAAGRGSVAVWLAGRVGPDGHVLATDLKPEHIPPHSRLEIRQHDITSDQPLGRFDLVHARLLLNHLPERDRALRHLVAALAPDGVLLTEDFWPTPAEELVASAPETRTAALIARYQQVHLAVLAAHGNDRTWSRRALAAFQAEGLTELQVTVHGSTWRGGGPGCHLLRAGLGQIRSEAVARGLSEQELDEVAEAFLDPRLIVNGHLVYLTSGRRPS